MYDDPAHGANLGARVIDHADYVDALARIVQRDFFPDLPVLRRQLGFLESLRPGELRVLRDGAKQLGEVGDTLREALTPAAFDEGRAVARQPLRTTATRTITAAAATCATRPEPVAPAPQLQLERRRSSAARAVSVVSVQVLAA